MKKIPERSRPVSVESIAKIADGGCDVSRFFEGQGRMMHPIQRANGDATAGVLEELNKAEQDLNATQKRGPA